MGLPLPLPACLACSHPPAVGLHPPLPACLPVGQVPHQLQPEHEPGAEPRDAALQPPAVHHTHQPRQPRQGAAGAAGTGGGGQGAGVVGGGGAEAVLCGVWGVRRWGPKGWAR